MSNLTILITKIYDKVKTMSLMTKIHDKLKIVVNSVRIPSLLSFFISKDGKINPTAAEALNSAPPANENWDRLGLEKETSIGLPRWFLFAVVIFIVSLRYWSEILTNILQTFGQTLLATDMFPNGAALPFKYAIDGLQFLVNFCAQFGALLPLALIGHYIWKSLTKK